MSKQKPFLDHSATIIPVADIYKTIQWYEEKMGFKVSLTWEDPITYAILKRDNLTFHFSQVDVDFKLSNPHPSIYVFVTQIEKLYEEFKSNGLNVSGLTKADYGMTDFDLYDLNGFRITFGQGSE